MCCMCVHVGCQSTCWVPLKNATLKRAIRSLISTCPSWSPSAQVSQIFLQWPQCLPLQTGSKCPQRVFFKTNLRWLLISLPQTTLWEASSVCICECIMSYSLNKIITALSSGRHLIINFISHFHSSVNDQNIIQNKA